MEIKLIDQLHKLKIDVSGTEENSIAAWNNKHMPDAEAFFNWFTRYLSENNVIEPSEIEEYSDLVSKKRLQDNDCGLVFIDVERTHNGIMDVELNISQIFVLESECDALKEHALELESGIKTNMTISKHIEKEIRTTKNKSDILSVKYENIYDICLGQGKKVDISFSDLRLKVLDCLVHWNNDLSIFSAGSAKLDQRYKDKLTNVSRLCSTPCLNSIALEVEKFNDAGLDTLGKRLYDAVIYFYVAKVKAKQLDAELAFYKNVDVLEGPLINQEDQWCLIQTESLELSNQISIENSLELLKELILEYVKNHMDKFKIIKLEKTVFGARKKYENICKMENTIVDILAYNEAYLNLFKIIDENIQAVDVFLREELPSIVKIDLRSCINRTELMKQRIQAQKDEQHQSIEKQNKLIRIIVDSISSQHIEEITPEVFKNLVNQFYGTILDYEMKLFFNDIDLYRNQVKVMEKNNYFIKEHLKSHSNNEIVICPMEYRSALFELREASKEAEEIVAKIIQDRKLTDETLKGNKWLRIRRQLWMYFLVNPRKITEYLNEIIEENKHKISVQICDDNTIIHNAYKYMND